MEGGEEGVAVQDGCEQDWDSLPVGKDKAGVAFVQSGEVHAALGRKLMAVAMDAGISKENVGSGIGKDSDEENNDGNKRKRRKSPRRAASASAASSNKRAKGAKGKAQAASGEKKGPERSKYQPKSMTGGILRDYQVEGLKWLVGLWENGLHGILADEMGLGKTIQVISLLAHLWDQHAWGAHLIVVPLSTLSNWVAEFQKWAPSIPVLMYHGSKDERPALIRKHLAGKPRECIPVVITTYEIVCRDRPELQRFSWKYVIVDEGHRLKNMNCRLIRELNMLATPRGERNMAVTRLLLRAPPSKQSQGALVAAQLFAARYF